MDIRYEITKDMAKEIEKAMKKNCTHRFVDANNGTLDKICVICGIRAKQAVMRFNQ